MAKLFSGLCLLIAVFGFANVSPAQPPTAAAKPVDAKVPPRKITVKDLRKGRIENPLKALVAKSRSKRETAAKRKTAREEAPAVKTGSVPFKNPKVEPGKVRWHRDFDKAVAVAGKSRKPVLLFQLIGRLDERFS